MLSDSKQCCEVLAGMLPERKPKGSVPVMVEFKCSPYGVKRYVLTDIPIDNIKAMLSKFREMEPEGTDEEFLTTLWDAVRKGTPRIFRHVDFISL